MWWSDVAPLSSEQLRVFTDGSEFIMLLWSCNHVVRLFLPSSFGLLARSYELSACVCSLSGFLRYIRPFLFFCSATSCSMSLSFICSISFSIGVLCPLFFLAPLIPKSPVAPAYLSQCRWIYSFCLPWYLVAYHRRILDVLLVMSRGRKRVLRCTSSMSEHDRYSSYRAPASHGRANTTRIEADSFAPHIFHVRYMQHEAREG